MQTTLFKKPLHLFILSLAIISLFLNACQKELSGSGITPIDIPSTPPDLSTKIASSVSGFVTDENEAAVEGAAVVMGTASATTDKFGYFEIRNAEVVQQAAVVTILKPGYFKVVKTYIAATGKAAFFRIKLLPKSTAGNIDAAAGGTVTLTNGLSISLPAGAVVNAATSAVYTGAVTVAAQWLSPTAADVYRTMPGDLRGLDSTGAMKLLTTYGMSAVELTGTSGELLQVAAGKKATVNFPLPPAVSAAAPATIPLWYFDETKGLWKQEGNAFKNGNNYIGSVSHFSYWNCDMPIDRSVQFNCTLVDGNGNPMPNVSVWIEYANGGYTGAHGYTDSTGYINGLLPANAQLVLQVYTDYQCTGPVYTQQVISGTTELSLGNITVPPSTTANFSGNVKDCNNAPVTDGYVLVRNGFYYYRVATNADGTFHLNTSICSTVNSDVTIFAVDNVTQQQGAVVTLSPVGGENVVGTLTACGTSIEEFINYSVNSTDYVLSGSPYHFYGAVLPLSNSRGAVYVQGSADSTGIFNNANFSFDESNIAVNSKQNLITFNTTQISDSVTVVIPILVNITEYGAVGQFIAGNFTGTLTGAPPANTPYTITCSFRVRRSQ